MQISFTPPLATKFFITHRLFILLALGFAMVVPGCKKDGHPPNGPKTAKLLVADLKELQGSTVGPDKQLYVTAPLDGTIWKVDPNTGDYTLFATGLPKRNPDPFYIGAGVIDVVFLGNTAYALVTGVAADLGGTDVVGIYQVTGPDSYTITADIGAWATEHPPVPDFFVATGFQYSFEPYRDGFIVADAHHNRLLYVTLDGGITEVIAFANEVPTGLSVKANTVFFTKAGPIPHHPEDAKLLTLPPKSPVALELASGEGLEVGLFVDVEFDRWGMIHVLAQGKWDGPFEGAPALPNTGALLKFKPNGSFSTVVKGLNQPTSLEFIGNNAYIVSLIGEVWKIDDCSPSAYGN
ncbi:hypothetical protein [Flavihumibacter solisilvae]|uniref:ScyD/ScyE family protein n=1 Tax=Flavihumibacter solisilvae TaxID=1349421 RepID=A0A0C1L8S6_9BACT|nr:hypothetical protein [Flavihumibacter solisilvae]KIC95966.1 hypothetical protein OI18_03550 [Flavihumibacter solisilvae]